MHNWEFEAYNNSSVRWVLNPQPNDFLLTWQELYLCATTIASLIFNDKNRAHNLDS